MPEDCRLPFAGEGDGLKKPISFCQKDFFAGGACGVRASLRSLRECEERRGPRPERRPEPLESWGLMWIGFQMSRRCSAREAHTRCTAPQVVGGVRRMRNEPVNHRRKTSPGGVGGSRREERPSRPPVTQRDKPLPHWDKATDEEGEKKSTHGIGCWLRETQAYQATWLAQHPAMTYASLLTSAR